MVFYMFLLAAVILLAPLLNGVEKNRKKYTFIVAALLFAVLAFRGVRVGSDLGRYESHFRFCMESDVSGIVERYKDSNTLFYLLMKAWSFLFHGSYHGFLSLLAVFEGCVFAFTVCRHSVNPYQSVLLYMAMGYYIFAFSGLKQALATAFIMLAFDAMIGKKFIRFLLCVLAAGAFHVPALIFLPVYFVGRRKFNIWIIYGYAAAIVLIFLYRDSLMLLLESGYESAIETEARSGVGGKVIMMAMFVIAGMLLRTPDGENTTYLATFHMMIMATMLQLFTVYGNVFERLADYYFIFVILYLPLVFEPQNRRQGSLYGRWDYGDGMNLAANAAILAFSVVYFYMTTSVTPGIIPYRLN